MEFALVKSNRLLAPRPTGQKRAHYVDKVRHSTLRIIQAIHETWISQERLLSPEDCCWPDHQPLTEYSSTTRTNLVDQLNRQEEIQEDKTHNGVVSSSSLQEKIMSAGICIRDKIQPQGDCPNDDSREQRILNVATSLPFFVVGMIMKRRLSSPEGKSYGNSMLMVGSAATLYHATSGPLRKLARKFDYYAIAHASGKMARALWPESNVVKFTERASWLITPFKPFFVSTGYALVMQAEFLRLGTKDASLKPHLFGHGLTAAAGIFAFSMEEVLDEHIGFKHMHSLWHCLSAYGVYTVGKLIEYKEARVLGSHQRIHDSALSLVDLDTNSVSKL